MSYGEDSLVIEQIYYIMFIILCLFPIVNTRKNFEEICC